MPRSPDGSSSPLLPSDDPATKQARSSEDGQAFVRDIIALTTLPAIWMGATPYRIAESLLAILETTIRPAFSYIFLPAPLGESDAPVELTNVDGQQACLEQTAELARCVQAWAKDHDPDDVLELSSSPAGVPVRVCTYRLGHDANSGVLAVGFPLNSEAPLGPTAQQRTLLNIAANQTITACRNVALQRQAEAARAETQGLYDVARALAAELDLQSILQKTTDAATQLTLAKFGAFFHNVTNERGESYTLFTLSGAPREAFQHFGMPRNTPLFDQTFRGRAPVRLYDVRADSRYGTLAPHLGMPEGHLPVRSYLAVPVLSRSGAVLGGLFFGHPEPGVFTERAERIAMGIAAQAAVALDNAQLFAQAQLEIAQRKAAEEALRDADRRKDEFLATLAHELRNPLAPIRTGVSILKKLPDKPAGFDDIAAMIERQSAHLVRLIDDLLDVSRITRGKIALHKERIDLVTVLGQALQSARPLADERRLQLSATLPPQPVPMDADPVRITQIVGNLLNNACKYTNPGGAVRLIAARDGDAAIVVRVKDTGIGIAPEALSHIFEMFAQLEGAISRAPGGLGIGLSLARSLAQLHGGTLTAHSEGVGKGSELVLRLPVTTAPHESATSGEAPVGVDAKPTAVPRCILAVDDYRDALHSTATLLRLSGHVVHTAVDGEGALEAAKRLRPDVVLLDIGLPDMDGYEVARKIRSEPWGKDILLVAMTGWGQTADKRRAEEAGFYAHLTKPADPGVLERLLREVARSPLDLSLDV